MATSTAVVLRMHRLLVSASLFVAALCGFFSRPNPNGANDDAILFDIVSLDSSNDAHSIESADEDEENPDDA